VTDAVRVLVVGPRASWRAWLTVALEADGDIRTVGQSPGGDDAVAAVRSLAPDLVVVAGDGDATTATVESIMAYAPKPIVVVKPADASDAAELAAGALAVLAWPADDVGLRQRVRVLRSVPVVRHPRARLRRTERRRPAPGAASRRPVIGMAASTGGPHTLATVLGGLGEVAAPVLVVQHIHADFVGGLVRWLAETTGRRTVVAGDGDVPEPGVVHVAPAGRHLTVAGDGRLALVDGPRTLHMPSANELFLSMAAALGSRAVGVLLTGMGDDGAAGLLAIHRAGGLTIVQDGDTAAIDGMPRAARDLGAAGVVAPLERIADAVRTAVGGRVA
jgi:two-component system chemotaxis response regulator CheB